MPEPILEVRKLNKSFGPVHVLHDVDLAVYPGEVTALVGDNGAGKSTLVKCIAGINSIDSGEVLFEGRPVHIGNPHDAANLGIEFVYQDLALADNLDITQNMFLGRELNRSGILSDGEMEQKARETLVSLSTDYQMNAFVFWPSGDRERQSRIWAEEVVPAAREALSEPG